MTPEKFVLPAHCGCCGAYLMGGATVHKPWCEFRKLIEEHFPRKVERTEEN